MKRMVLAAFSWAVVLAAAAPSAAQVPPSEEDGVRLSLQQCLETALQNNLDLVIARKSPQIAEQGVDGADAAFDPALSAEASANGFKGEPQRVFQVPGRGNTVGLGASWAQNLRFGGNYSIGLASDKSEGAGLFYQPSYNSGLALKFNLPLLEGFGEEVATSAIVLARGDLEISREKLRSGVHDTLETVEGAYWELVATRAALRVARQSLKLAHDLLSLNQKKVEVGTLAPIEVTQAEAGVASREEGVILAETAVGNAEDNLRRFLAIPHDDPAWNRPIIPTDQPDFRPRVTDLEASIRTALEAHPSVISARRALQNSQLDEVVAHNALKPKLDLAVSLTPSGNNLKSVSAGPDGIPETDDDQVITGGLGESITEIPKLNNYNWATGLTYTIPIGNRAAKASYKVSTLNREKSEIELQSAEQDVRVDVRIAVRNVDAGIKRVAAARANVDLQRKKLEAEQKKFDNGMSTSFEVLTFQNDLADAELALIRAALDYIKSIAALEKAQGTLLEARGLTLETSK